MMNRINFFVATALTVGAFACDRNRDTHASETNTTSATTTPTPTTADPAARSPVVITEQTTPSEALTTAPAFRAKDAGASGSLTTGTSTGTQTNGASNPNGGTATTTPDDGNVAPGHIMFPPDKGSSAPDRGGSRNMGTGAPKR